MRLPHLRCTALILAGLATWPVLAADTLAPIDRVKITDNDMTCPQIAEEHSSMDKVVAEAQASQSSGQTKATAGAAAGVAADVASRTGIFGAIGGLGGHLFGSVASKAAAQTVEQQGGMDAVQAAERQKQALARKDHLAQLFLNKRCATGDAGTAAASTPAPATPQSAQPAPAPSPATPLAIPAGSQLALDVAVVNPEDLLDFNKTVLVPTVYLVLLTDGRVSASKQAGMFQQGSGSARASANYRVSGLDKAYAQRLAQAAYDDFVTRMRQAGYKVLTYADVSTRDYIQSAQRESAANALPTESEGGINYIVATPTDEQHFKGGLAGGLFNQFISLGKSKVTDATVIIPRYVFHAPQAWGESSRGYKSVSAEANVAPGMNMWTASAHWLGAPKSRMMRGIPGVATKSQLINATETAGTLAKTADTTPQAANAISAGLGSLFGGGAIQSSSGEYQLTIDRQAYAQGIMNGVSSFNAEVAKAATSAKP